jgi:hypothetical protein
VKRRLLVPVAIVGALLSGRAYLSRAGTTPEGQPPLTTVSSLETLQAQFNREQQNTRVLILIAPTCPYCLKGASAIERVLEANPGEPLTVLVVWQPMLSTDWGQPGTRVLRRLSDPRVRQFWDPDRRAAAALEQSFRDREPGPACCFQNGIWWDLMAVFPPGRAWGERLPEPTLLDGTVDDAAPAFEALLGPTRRAGPKGPEP